MAATGTPTPNIGLRRAQGTDPASVDDINYNSALIDTKLGAVGNSSVQDQIDTLNSKKIGSPDYANGYNKSSTSFTVTEDGYVQCGIRATEKRLIVVSVNGYEANRTIADVVGSGTVFPSSTPLIYVKNGDAVTVDYQVISAIGSVYQTLEMFYPIR